MLSGLLVQAYGLGAQLGPGSRSGGLCQAFFQYKVFVPVVTDDALAVYRIRRLRSQPDHGLLHHVRLDHVAAIMAGVIWDEDLPLATFWIPDPMESGTALALECVLIRNLRDNSR